MLSRTASNIFRLFRPKIGTVSVRNHSVDYPKCKGLIIETRDQVLWIKLDRPQKYNAISREMFAGIGESFNKANSDDSIKAVVLTGQGEYYSSGNDLGNLMVAMQDEGGPKVGLTKARDLLKQFVDSIINLEKLLIAAVNGPAIGIAVTTLPLFDYVIASDKATFQTPFTAIGQCPEACSSWTLPRIAGPSKANELLLLNMTWDAHKAHSNGLVAQVIHNENLNQHLDNFLYGKRGIVKTCYPKSLIVSKALTMSDIKQNLLDINVRECDAILGQWLGEECADAVEKFFNRSNK